MALDELDAAIVRALQDDARRTNRDLAHLIGVSPSTALERTRSLRARGVILGYHADVDLAALNRTVHAMISVRLRPQTRRIVETFREQVMALPETLEVFLMAGENDYLIHVAVRDTLQLRDFVLDHLAQRREIADVRTSAVYEYRRKTLVEPLPPAPR
jgi:DNA-binding Lrp family transcriptional regulator